MRNDDHDHLWLTAAQCAKRIGLTVRALRLYEESGLIQPRRTGKNWRLYGSTELARLNEILTLKQLGFSLQDIARLLAGQAIDLKRMLSLQALSLREQIVRIQSSLAIVDALNAKVVAGKTLTTQELLKLARETNMTDSALDRAAWLRYEQARPRTEHPIDPALYDDYVGTYRLDAVTVVISVREGALFARLTGQGEIEIFPEAADRFFLKIVPAQITFTRDETGLVRALVLHQDGFEQVAPRVPADLASALEEDLAKRVADKQPMENSEALLRALIDQHQRGEPDYERMTEPLAALAKAQASMIRADLQRMGALETLTFKGVSESGWDVYDVRFEKGRLEWSVALAPDGKVSGLFIRPEL